MSEIKELKEKIKNFKVLFVDDEQEIRDSLGNLLKRFFNEVVICSNGQEALEAFNKSKDFDIVMSDVMMPRMGGVELVGKIKEMKPEIFTVYITASKSSVLCEEDAHNILLQKPLSFDEMVIILKKIGDIL